MKNKFGLVFAGAIVAVTCIALPAFSQRSYSKWSCYLNNQENQKVGNVKIWWGHNPTDASWACNNWISTCVTKVGVLPSKTNKLYLFDRQPQIANKLA